MLVKQQSNVINQILNFMCVGFQASIAMGGVFIIVLLTFDMHCNNYDIVFPFGMQPYPSFTLELLKTLAGPLGRRQAGRSQKGGLSL